MVSVFGFTKLLPSVQNTEESIIGTWVADDDSKSKMRFDSIGKCYSEYTGESTDVYNYSITKETSSNGKITFETLKLINTSDSNDVYVYDINSIDDQILVLQYLKNNKLLYYSKEQ
ncbi:MAG: hypothetical protein ACWIPI_10235 [Polaribacter sp.]